ncbi:hypothetical protein D3C73_1021530 [compost metagenome]
MKFSVFALFPAAFCTSSRILETADSPKVCVTCTVMTPLRLMNPLSTWLPGSALRGTDSPVSAEVSIMALPSSTLPSSGTFSPGFTTMISPISTSSGATRRRPTPSFR